MSYSQIVLDDGPVFYHRFLTGVEAYDSTLNGDSVVTSRGSITFNETGSPVEDTPAYASSNGSGYMTMSGNTVSPSGDFTVEAWVRYTTLTSDGLGVAISKGAALANRTFRFGTQSGDWGGLGVFYLGVCDSNRVERRVSSLYPLNNGQWHHVVGVVRGTTIELWVDGELHQSNAFVDYPPASSTGPYEYFQYGQGGYSSYRFRGDLASPAVYHRALTKREIQTHYMAANAIGTLNGVTNINTVPSECTVRVYERETGNLIVDLLSDDITGEYSTIVPLSGQYDIVCIGDETVCPQISGPLNPTPYEAVSSFVGFPVLKLEFNDGDGSTTITDSSPYSRTCTGFGNAVQRDTQVRSGVSSLFLGGLGDYIRITSLGFFSITTDFTIETWIYRTSASETDRDAIVTHGASSSNGFYFGINTSGKAFFSFGVGSYETFVLDQVISLNQWVNVAVCLEGSNIRGYVNGIKVLDDTLVGTPVNHTSYMYIGRDSRANPVYDRDFQGYIDSIEFTLGYAKYTDDFTPV